MPADDDREVLVELGEMAPVTVRQIADGIGWEPQRVRRALGRLETHGLVVNDTYQVASPVWLLTDRGEAVVNDG